jgi:hypothetical protein
MVTKDVSAAVVRVLDAAVGAGTLSRIAAECITKQEDIACRDSSVPPKFASAHAV